MKKIKLRPLLTSRKTTEEWDAKRIRNLRDSYYISQEQLRHLLGTRQQTISEWELGLYKPMWAYSKLLDNLALDLGELWNRVSLEMGGKHVKVVEQAFREEILKIIERNKNECKQTKV